MGIIDDMDATFNISSPYAEMAGVQVKNLAASKNMRAKNLSLSVRFGLFFRCRRLCGPTVWGDPHILQRQELKTDMTIGTMTT